MPLTQENRLDNFSNNNDHSYLHKKFKKMASSISVLPANLQTGEENVQRDINPAQSTANNTTISNRSIAAAHPEIEKIKEYDSQKSLKVENNVQTNYSDENTRLSDVNNIHVSGKTSYSEEFLKKTENYENDFSKDAYSGGAGRYICPYCKLPCAKPSVLQKHIRAHTNERPFPCVPCGFAFKTKSNLYKHRRSRTHALRSQGAEITTSMNDEDLSGGSESDTSITLTSITDTGSDASILRVENSRQNEFSSPELSNEVTGNLAFYNDNKSKTIYKPKFRAAFYQGYDEKDKIKKNISTNAEFLTEHISKIISDNEAIVDVIETPLQKKYNKIKQIAESKQFVNEREIKQEITPLNLTKNTYEFDSLVRKRSHSESFTQSEEIKHPLNPEGSIIKDLLLKTKANGISSLIGELEDGVGPLFICPLCQIIYRSADNLEIHRFYYCKGNATNNTVNAVPHKDTKTVRPENVYLRSNSINVRLPESQNQSSRRNVCTTSPPLKNKPDNLVILKPENNDIIAPLPSPGPLLGNTRLVDTRLPIEFNRKNEYLKTKPKDPSPKRRLDSRSDSFSPRLIENASPRSIDLYSQTKMRCIDSNSALLRSIDEIQMRHNSTSLQMFGGEVKILDHSGSTTTLRIEPSKNQLSPIMIQQSLSPSKFASDSEASSVVVRSGLHSGGTIVHNPPTPKENISTPQTPRITVSTPNIQNSGMLNIRDITHFQFPPLSAITAYNPLTLPPLSPTSSPTGATSILHGGKIIPHVPGIPGPNTTGGYVGSITTQVKSDDMYKGVMKSADGVQDIMQRNITSNNGLNFDKDLNLRNNKFISSRTELAKHDHSIEIQKSCNVPLITIRNVDDPSSSTRNFSSSFRPTTTKQDLKRNADGISRTTLLKENSNYSINKYKQKETNFLNKNIEQISESEIKSFNFENLITKAEIYNNQIQNSSEGHRNTNAQETSITSSLNERSETSYFQKNLTVTSASEERKPKFLRPSSLPLKPGTFTPKRHHGITPNANTMPLVSPETPRPAKAYGQLYLNGNAYTYLGLKCSTKVFYCTINRPQPTYVPNQHFLSMYSNWQLLSELTPDPLGLSASSAMSLYDSRHRPQTVTVAVIKQDLILTHSSQWNKKFNDNKQITTMNDTKKEDCKVNPSDGSIVTKKELAGGFESNEEYTYVRGRGRGRYVCLECGIRCKKPSMLKKHIRTHTDVRPYTCIHCVFSFKTKGNLTKHMKSKAHYKKCCELGINPNEENDSEGVEMTPCPEESDEETDSEGDDGNEGETESSDTEFYKSRLPEHEAAHCLLSLGGNRLATTTTPGLITSARPSTYPYTPIMSDNTVYEYNTEISQEPKNITNDSRLDSDNEPMDLSKSDYNTPTNVTEIPTARESSVLASLASNTAKLPQHQSQWANGEPMLHTYLTEMALLDSKIKQSQVASNISKVRKVELERSMFNERDEIKEIRFTSTNTEFVVDSKSPSVSFIDSRNECVSATISKDEDVSTSKDSYLLNNGVPESKRSRTPSNSNSENAKQVVSEYLKHARISLMKTLDDSSIHENSSDDSNSSKINLDDKTKIEELTEGDTIKISLDESTSSKIVIGGVSFKVNKDKDFDSTIPYSPSKLMDDGRRVCDFCNKTFTKPSQLKLHLNIHYMERPFRCSVCAVSFRTKGHLQKHERSGSHHNKVSMTSTFGAATSFNPRPFRCSDCNIAFRIHGHLAKHLRSKMHVMRLECLFKLPFGTFTEIERAGLSLTDIDTTDCASSLASLQCLARKLHEKDPTRLEYREPSGSVASLPPAGRESSEEEEVAVTSEKSYDIENDSEMKTIENSESQDSEQITFSATDN